MILKRFYEDPLAQASFLVGCAGTGEAAVIDATRDIDQYLEAAAAEDLRIVAVTETHIHADYVSGSRELAARTGATLYLSDEGDASWKYAFAHEPNVRLVRHGDHVRVGNVRLDVRRTPGHTPEHLAFVLVDEPASPEPLGVFTGDFVFVGDVGRPDLLERAAHIAGTMEKGARTLFRELQLFKQLPDRLLVWPGHGSGSACGRSLGGVPVTTIGYEKLANWGLRLEDEGAFVDEVLAGQPEPPAYFKEMKRINKEGPPPLGGLLVAACGTAQQLADRLADGALVVDVRPARDTAAGRLPGAITIPLSRMFATWAGSVLPFGTPVHLVGPDEATVRAAVRQLALIGYDAVPQWFGPDAVAGYEAVSSRRLQREGRVAPREAAACVARGEVTVLDVRGQREWDEGHLPGARHVPLTALPGQLDDLPAGPIVVHCAAGARSAIAGSLLRRAGRDDVLELKGGFQAWVADGLPVEGVPATACAAPVTTSAA